MRNARPEVIEASSPGAGCFRLDGDFWTVTFEGVTVRVRDAKGMRYLAFLLGHPDQRFDAAQLASALTPAVGAPLESVGSGHDDRARSAVSKRIWAAIRHLQNHHPAVGHFLTATIHTGYACSYSPDPGRPVRWER